MIKPVICVYDKKAESYSAPFYAQSKGVAIREFADVINKADENSLYYKHPEDFDLYCLGEFDDKTAKFSLSEVPELLINGVTAKQ
jgi:hypothetical protein